MIQKIVIHVMILSIVFMGSICVGEIYGYRWGLVALLLFGWNYEDSYRHIVRKEKK